MIAVLRRVSGFLPIALVLAAGSPPLHAQSRAAQISGTVVDPVGHVLPGVTVTLEMVEGRTFRNQSSRPWHRRLDGHQWDWTVHLRDRARGHLRRHRGTGRIHTRLHSSVLVLEGQSIDLRLSLPWPPWLRLSTSSLRPALVDRSRRTKSRPIFFECSSSPPIGFRSRYRFCPASSAIQRDASVSTALARARVRCW